MKRIGVLACAFVLVASVAWGRSLPTVEPEKVGLSSERLQRIAQVFQQEIDQGRLPGAVVLIARKGEIAYFESFGMRDKAAATRYWQQILELTSEHERLQKVKELLSAAAVRLERERQTREKAQTNGHLRGDWQPGN